MDNNCLNIENFKQMNERINKEIENGRKQKNILNEDKVKDIYTFETLTNDELFSDKKIHLIYEISKKLNFCLDNNCSNPKCKNFCLIYTNKKTGSTSLWSSLNLYLFDKYSIWHIHNISTLEMLGIYSISVKQIIQILKKYNKNVFVIDIYRPIFDICASNYFNNLSIHFQRDFNLYPDLNNKKMVIIRFLELFKYLYNYYDVDYYTDVYEMDIKNMAFDFHKKHLYCDDGNIKYIKLRLCDSDNWGEILSQYFGKNIKIFKCNDTNSKKVGNLYNYFKDNIFIQNSHYELIKNNKHFKYYYSDEEQKKYLNNFKIIENISIDFSDSEFKFYDRIIMNNEVPFLYSSIVAITNAPDFTSCMCKKCSEKRINFLKENDTDNYKELIKNKQNINNYNGINHYQDNINKHIQHISHKKNNKIVMRLH